MKVKTYTELQLDEIEKIALDAMGYIPGKKMTELPADVLAYVKMALSSQEQLINWLTGFGQCLEEAKLAISKGGQDDDQNGGEGGMTQHEEDDGLVHFGPNSGKLDKKLSQQNDENSKKYVPIDDDDSDDDSGISDENINTTPELLAANRAKLAANKAQKAADAAQKAADAAQKAAGMNGSPKAQEAAGMNGSPKAQEAADRAQEAADRAQEAANEAQEAANKALTSANNAEQHRNDGNSGGANNELYNAGEAAVSAGEAAKKAGEAAKEAADAAREAGAAAGEQSDGMSLPIPGQENGQQSGQSGLQSGLSGQQSRLSGQQSGLSGQQSGQSGLQSGLSGQQSGQSGQQSGQSGLQSGLSGQQSGLSGQQSGQSGQQSGLSGQQSGQNGIEQAANEAEAAGNKSTDAGQTSETFGEGVKKMADDELQNGNKFQDGLGDPNGDLSKVTVDGDINDISFNPTDVCGEDGMSNQERMDKIAKNSGLTLDEHDDVNPIEYLKMKYEEVKNMKSSRGHQAGAAHTRGMGNSIEDVFNTIDQLFSPIVNWRNVLKKLFNSKAETDKDDAMARRRFGVEDTHPFYKGRYQHPDEINIEKLSGIMLVFLLVDNSGSMWGLSTGNSKKQGGVFDNIMSEIINLEKKTNIQNSCMAWFGSGIITKDQVRVWHNKDCKNVQKLVNYLRQRPGDNGGGTSVGNAIVSLPELGKKYFSNNADPKKLTLLIVITDGEDNYNDLGKILEYREKQKTIFLICNDNDSILKKTKTILEEQGIKSGHILLVNTVKEW